MRDIDETAKRFLPLTEATFYILASLIEPRHGYGIMQNVAALSENQVRIGPGTIYGALSNLVKQDLIERVGELESEGERRKVYGLTGLGRRVVVLESKRLTALTRIAKMASDVLESSPSEE